MQDYDTLARAAVLWTGRGSSHWPQRDDEAVIREFGDEEGFDVLARLVELQDAFYESNANVEAPDLPTMAHMAAADFRAKYPGMPDDLVDAFVWCYTFDYK